MCYGVKISLRKQLAFRSAATGFPTKWHTSTKIPRWWCSLTRVCLLTDSFCENWNLRKVLEKIGKLLWKLMLPVIITTHMIIVCGRSGRHKKGRGGSEKCESLPFFIPIPLPISLRSYPLPLLTNTCYTGLYCTRTSEGNWQMDSKENFFRKVWVNFNWRTELFNKLCIKTGFANWNGNRQGIFAIWNQ